MASLHLAHFGLLMASGARYERCACTATLGSVAGDGLTARSACAPFIHTLLVALISDLAGRIDSKLMPTVFACRPATGAGWAGGAGGGRRRRRRQQQRGQLPAGGCDAAGRCKGMRCSLTLYNQTVCARLRRGSLLMNAPPLCYCEKQDGTWEGGVRDCC